MTQGLCVWVGVVGWVYVCVPTPFRSLSLSFSPPPLPTPRLCIHTSFACRCCLVTSRQNPQDVRGICQLPVAHGDKSSHSVHTLMLTLSNSFALPFARLLTYSLLVSALMPIGTSALSACAHGGRR